MKVRDCMWLWAHPERRFDEEYKDIPNSRMTPMEGCLYFGVKNVFMCPVCWSLDRRQYNKSFTTLENVAWECYAAGKDPDVIRQIMEESRDFDNVTAMVYDDFVRGGEFREIPVENLYKVRDILHSNDIRRMDMWMVLYTNEFGLNEKDDTDFMKYIEPFDGITLWTWKESDVPLIPEKFEIFKRLTPDKKRMFGCYLWNFGEEKQGTRQAVEWQLDWYLEKIRNGEAHGIVLHSNTYADHDYDAFAAAREWMKKHGDEEI